jgi:hypothetical protein
VPTPGADINWRPTRLRVPIAVLFYRTLASQPEPATSVRQPGKDLLIFNGLTHPQGKLAPQSFG